MNESHNDNTITTSFNITHRKTQNNKGTQLLVEKRQKNRDKLSVLYKCMRQTKECDPFHS